MNYTIKNEKLAVTVSDMGAELQSIKGADGTEYLWQGDPQIWDGKAPNLFPYIARMTGEKYTVYGKQYAMKIHGFVMYRTLTMENQTADSITFRLDSDEETRVQYPFEFTYRITYTLEENTLVTTVSVENRDSRRMFFGVGGHPGFMVPLEEGLTFEDYVLQFSEASQPYRVGFSDTCFLTGQDAFYPLQNGKEIALKHELFDQDAIVLKNMPKTVKLCSEKGKHSVTVTYPDFAYLGFWHMPKREAPYVCIEPWSSLPSREGVIEDLEFQSDLLRLDAGKTYENVWKIMCE